MYSQYSQSSAQQPQTHTWNGTQWQATNNTRGGSWNNTPQTTSNTNLISQYTQYYHAWKAITDNPASSPSQQQTAQFNADQSSRAAHYFHNNPNVLTAPPHLQLPPPPPSSQTTLQSQPQSSPASASNAMKQYLDRCMQQAGPAHKQAIVQQFEAMIQTAVQSGAIHSIDWDRKPLITVPGVTSTGASGSSYANGPNAGGHCGSNGPSHQPQLYQSPHQQQQRPLTHAVAASNNYYGPSLSRPSGNGTNMDSTSSPSYYGPSSGSSTSNYGPPSGSSPNYYRPSSLSTQKTGNDYYGPGGGSTGYSSGTGGQNSSTGGQNSSTSYYGPATSSTGTNATISPKTLSNQNVSSATDYYGPSSSPPTAAVSNKLLRKADKKEQKLSKKKKRKQQAVESESYYGPSTSNSNPSTDDDYIALSSKTSNSWKRRKSGFDKSKTQLSRRAERFSGPGGCKEAAESTAKSNIGSEWNKYMGKTTIGGSNKVLDEEDYEKMTVKGTCTVLEKSYLRLTAPPRADMVRPLSVLQQHLENLKTERKRGGRDYLWFCSQFKAVRQDCTVQRIQNSFAVDVYETHARVALAENDMNEFNQCQTQLMYLYALLAEKVDDPDAKVGLQNRTEFLSYRVLYCVFLSVENDGGSSDFFKILSSMSEKQRNDLQVQHALKVRAACGTLLNYHRFFLLRNECPTAGAEQLMDRMLPSVRFQALKIVALAYRPTPLDLTFVLSELGFSDDKKATKFGRKWLRSCGCVLSDDKKSILTKETTIRESDLEQKQSLI